MSQKASKDGKLITKNRAAGIAAVCFVTGFVAGVAYSTLAPDTGAIRETAPSAALPAAAVGTPEMTGRILALEQKVSDDPGNLASWLELGNLYFDIGNPKNAIRAYGKYIDGNPANPDVWTDLGVMYRQDGQPGEAIRCFERALSFDPDHQQSRYNKGVVLLHDMRDIEAALKEWRTLAEKHPDFRTQDGRSIQDIVKNRQFVP